MKIISILLVFLTIVFISVGAIVVVQFFDPSATATPLLILGIIVGASMGAAQLLSALQDGSQFYEELLSSWGLGAGRNYKKKYLEYMFFRHRNFDVKGLTTQGVYTLELSRIFVELSVAPRKSQDISNNPLSFPIKTRRKNYSIWKYLQFSKGENPNFAIIGVPGSGKTTMLKHMTLALIGKTQGGVDVENVPKKLPILLYLRDHARQISEDRDPLFTLEDAIQKDLRKWDKTAPKGWFTKELNDGNGLVMLDGLDEVADLATRLKVVQWVDRQLIAYPLNSFIITSRPHGYRSNPLSDVMILEVRSFDSKQQIKFIRNWYLANEIRSQQRDDEGVQIDAKEGSDDLIKRIYHTPKLSSLAVNPLLLTMIATIHKYRSSLPGRRVELYSEIHEVFLGKRQQSKGIVLDLTPEQRKRVLQPLAWYMMKNRIRDVGELDAEEVIKLTLTSVQHYADPKIFLKNIENDSGLLTERESGRYSFAHLTFQEFLAAEHVRDQPDLLNELLSYVNESWWHEVLLLYAARADATPIVEACLTYHEAEDISALLLAVNCLDEAREVSPETQRRLEKVLEESLNGQDLQRIGILAKLILQQRVRGFIRIYEGKTVDISLLTNAEYQLFIDEVSVPSKSFVPLHWQGGRYSSGQGGLPVLGVSTAGAEAFCRWLTDTMDDGFQYTIPIKVESQHIPMKINDAVPCAGYWVKNNKNYSIEMCAGDYPELPLALLNNYRNRALNSMFKMGSAQGVARKKDLDFSLITRRYSREAYNLNLRKIRKNGVRFGFPSVQMIIKAKKLNEKAIDEKFNPDFDLCMALVGDMKLGFGNDLQQDLTSLLMIGGLLLSRLKLEEESISRTVRNEKPYEDWQNFAERLIAAYTTAFVNLCMFEEIKNGKLLPFEGLRLIRIQKHN